MQLNPKSCMFKVKDVEAILFTKINWEGKQVKWELLHRHAPSATSIVFLPKMSSGIPQNLVQCSFLREQARVDGLFENTSLHNTFKTYFKDTILGFLIGCMCIQVKYDV